METSDAAVFWENRGGRGLRKDIDHTLRSFCGFDDLLAGCHFRFGLRAGTMQVPDWLPGYGATAFAALCGSLARGKAWQDETGRLLMARVFPELATAIGLSVGVMALGAYANVDLRVLAGIAVFAGWLGPAAVGELVLSKIGSKSP